jgi:hypothetical protein
MENQRSKIFSHIVPRRKFYLNIWCHDQSRRLPKYGVSGMLIQARESTGDKG